MSMWLRFALILLFINALSEPAFAAPQENRLIFMRQITSVGAEHNVRITRDLLLCEAEHQGFSLQYVPKTNSVTIWRKQSKEYGTFRTREWLRNFRNLACDINWVSELTEPADASITYEGGIKTTTYRYPNLDQPTFFRSDVGKHEKRRLGTAYAKTKAVEVDPTMRMILSKLYSLPCFSDLLVDVRLNQSGSDAVALQTTVFEPNSKRTRPVEFKPSKDYKVVSRAAYLIFPAGHDADLQGIF